MERDEWTDVQRREFLRRTSAVALATIAETTTWRAAALNADVLTELERVTEAFRNRDRMAGVTEIVVGLTGHVERMSKLLRATATPDPLRVRLASATADAAQLAGWFAFDMTEPVGAWNWFSLAQELAREAGDEDLHALALARISRVLVASHERPNPDAALGVLHRIRRERLAAATRAMVAVHISHAYAAYGDERSAMRVLGEAARNAERADAEAEKACHPWISANNSMYVANWAGTVQLQVGRIEQADEAWTAVLTQFPAQNVRARGELLLDLGKAALRSGDVERSCQRAASAFDVFTRTNSKRHLAAIAAFRASLAPYADTHAVCELDEYLHAS